MPHPRAKDAPEVCLLPRATSKNSQGDRRGVTAYRCDPCCPSIVPLVRLCWVAIALGRRVGLSPVYRPMESVHRVARWAYSFWHNHLHEVFQSNSRRSIREGVTMPSNEILDRGRLTAGHVGETAKQFLLAPVGASCIRSVVFVSALHVGGVSASCERCCKKFVWRPRFVDKRLADDPRQNLGDLCIGLHVGAEPVGLLGMLFGLRQA